MAQNILWSLTGGFEVLNDIEFEDGRVFILRIRKDSKIVRPASLQERYGRSSWRKRQPSCIFR
jgi:hypothetical protein